MPFSKIPISNNRNLIIENILLLALKAALVCFFAILVLYHFRLVTFPFPLEIREGGDLLAIKAISEKINLYDISNQPIFNNPYGLVFPYFAQKISVLFGVNLFSPRLLAAISIYFVLVLSFIAFRKEKIDLWMSFSGVLILYSNLLFFVTPLCRPDSLAMAFFFISILWPVWYRFSNSSLLTGLIFSLIAFYTKQYFIIGYFFVIIYVLIFVSIKRASIFLTAFVSLLILSLFIFDKYFECYLFDTILTHVVVSNNDFHFALHQLNVFLFTNSGLTLILIISLAILITSKRTHELFRKYKNNFRSLFSSYFNRLRYITDWNKGLVNFHLNPYVFLFATLLSALVFRLGGNTGAYMTYYYQLLSFPFIMIVFKFHGRFSKSILIVLILLNFYTSGKKFLIPENTISGFNKEWQKADELLKTSKNVFSTAEVSALIIEDGGIPYNTGYTEFSISSTMSKKIRKLFPFTNKIKTQNSRYDMMVKEKIENKSFDLLLINSEFSNSKKEILKNHYFAEDSMELNYYHANQKVMIYAWRPLP